MDQISSDQQQRLNSAGLTEDIRGVMADIERRLDRLRAAHADREREREELESQSEAVEQRAQQLEAAANELADRQREHEGAVAAAESRFAELDLREVRAREAFEQAKARHDSTRAELAQQREQLAVEDHGVLVEGVSDGPARKAGVREGDVLLMLNNEKVADVAAFRRLAGDLPSGKAVSVLVQRQGNPIFLALKTDE